MKLPFVIEAGFIQEHSQLWNTQFVLPGRTRMESIWRRTQDVANKELSGWERPTDMRRRMLHYSDQYALEPDGEGMHSFQLQAPYLWLSLAFPREEMQQYKDRIGQALQMGQWVSHEDGAVQKVYVRGDLRLIMTDVVAYSQDTAAGRVFPEGYVFFEVLLDSSRTELSAEYRQYPWYVLKSGIRVKDMRGNPTITHTIDALGQYLPMQVELGCGASIEAGIPPLHYLHEVYSVSDHRTGRFILNPEEDHLLYRLVSDPEQFYRDASLPYRAALKAEPTEFFKLIQTLHAKGDVVGPIITNNFDGLCVRLGLPELYVRRYDEAHIIPKIAFHPAAKSLLVCGAHADRRKIERAARNAGLQLIYVDPEGYTEAGQFRQYFLESPQDGDIVIRMTAGEFAEAWQQTFLGTSGLHTGAGVTHTKSSFIRRLRNYALKLYNWF